MIKQSIDNKANDTSKVAPMTKLVPKDQLMLVVQGSFGYKVRWKWSNLPEGFEEFWVDALVYQRCNDVRLLLRMLNQKTMIFQKSKDLWWKTQDVDLCLWIFCEPHMILILSVWQERGPGVWIWCPLREGIQMLSKLVGLAFQLPPTFLTCCSYGEKHIVVHGRKLVLRANAKRFSWPIVHCGG